MIFLIEINNKQENQKSKVLTKTEIYLPIQFSFALKSEIKYKSQLTLVLNMRFNVVSSRKFHLRFSTCFSHENFRDRSKEKLKILKKLKIYITSILFEIKNTYKATLSCNINKTYLDNCQGSSLILLNKVCPKVCR